MQITSTFPVILSSNQVKTLFSIANLKVAIYQLLFRVSENQFDLYMKVDTNTNGHRQWFYFSVRNNKKIRVKFNIFRFKKRYSLFQRGMRPYARSIKAQNSWQPCGSNISYRFEKGSGDMQKKEKRTYYLTFQYTFEHQQDQVYFCCGIPYTYTYLQQRLTQFKQIYQGIHQQSQKKVKFEVDQTYKTLCGLQLPILTIESDNDNQKKYLVINARTHPGEASASWVVDGFIEKLLISAQIRQWIIQNDISFKIFPMLNPDGVFLGNYRTGIVGDDFNRKFSSGKKEIFPQIHTIRTITNNCKKKGTLYLFLDIHGHSILKNSFLYGPVQSLFIENPLRNLPFTMWHSSKYFQLSSCKFRFQKQMAETARVYFQLKQNILSYTSETSLGLYQGATRIQMLQNDYKTLGGSMVQSISDLLNKENITKFQQMVPNRKQKVQEKIQEKSFTKKTQQKSEFSQQAKQKTKANGFFDKIIFEKKKQSIEMKQKKVSRNSIYLQGLKSTNSSNKNQTKIIKRDNSYSLKGYKIEKKQSISNVNDFNKTNFNEKKINQSLQKEKQHEKKANTGENTKRSKVSQFYQKEEKQKIKIAQKQYSSHDNSLDKEPKLENKFKIRKKSDGRNFPESFKRKIGSKIFMPIKSTKHFVNSQQEFNFERSVTHDSVYLNSQMGNLPKLEEDIKKLEIVHDDDQNLEVINQQNFSEEYSSMNDSDSSSQDLEEKKKQYIIECIKNNRRLKTNWNNGDNDIDSENEDNLESTNNLNSNINRFKQIQFKSLQSKNRQHLMTIRHSKRDPNKFRDINQRSLGRNINDEYDPGQLVNMVQRKQLNQRVYRKTQRQPYFLMQIKNKHN